MSADDSSPAALEERYAAIRERIGAAARASGREPSAVRLVAVSKRQPESSMVELMGLGHREFGENYVQEAKSKVEGIKNRRNGEAVFHLIGHLQRNKAREAVRLFDVIQSVDRPELASELAKEAGKAGKQQKILLQIKIAEEESKSGCAAEDAEALLASCRGLPELEIQGLMCIGGFGLPETDRRKEFCFLRELRETLEARSGAKLPELSMGMSDDFELAIREGATIVRVGTALFGARA